MNTFNIGEIIGSIIINLAWLLLVGYSIFKSFKRKQKGWILVLIINLIAGWFFPMYFVSILPLIYLIKYKNFGKRKLKEKELNWKNWIIITLVTFISFIILSSLDPNHAIEVIITSISLGYLTYLATKINRP